MIVPGANDGLSPSDVRQARDAFSAASVDVCQLEAPIETTLEAFCIAKYAGVMAILNPAPLPRFPASS